MKTFMLIAMVVLSGSVFAQDVATTELQIKKILNKMYKEDKVADKTFNFCILYKLMAGTTLTETEKTECKASDTTNESAVYNDIMVKNHAVTTATDARDMYHMFTADEVRKNQLLQLAGCTGASRVFYDYATKGTLDFPASKTPFFKDKIKYIITSRECDYIAACPQKGISRDDAITINGHQVVAVKVGTKWRILNTSAQGIEYATYWDNKAKTVEVSDVNELNPLKNGGKLVEIRYGNMEGAPYAITAVLDIDDVFSHKILMNYSVSGTKTSDVCTWDITAKDKKSACPIRYNNCKIQQVGKTSLDDGVSLNFDCKDGTKVSCFVHKNNKEYSFFSKLDGFNSYYDVWLHPTNGKPSLKDCKKIRIKKHKISWGDEHYLYPED